MWWRVKIDDQFVGRVKAEDFETAWLLAFERFQPEVDIGRVQTFEVQPRGKAARFKEVGDAQTPA